jgi:hypothetical protein
MAVGQGCRASLPGKAAGQGCRARLPGKASGHGCLTRLPGMAARQGCRARLPARRARLRLFLKIEFLLDYLQFHEFLKKKFKCFFNS